MSKSNLSILSCFKSEVLTLSMLAYCRVKYSLNDSDIETAGGRLGVQKPITIQLYLTFRNILPVAKVCFGKITNIYIEEQCFIILGDDYHLLCTKYERIHTDLVVAQNCLGHQGTLTLAVVPCNTSLITDHFAPRCALVQYGACLHSLSRITKCRLACQSCHSDT